MLLRSVHSILDNTPSHLVDTIILVDDKSTMGQTWTRHSTTQYNTMQHNTVQCNKHNTTRRVTPCGHRHPLRRQVDCGSVMDTAQYNTVQHNTIQYNTMQHNTVQCNKHNTTRRHTLWTPSSSSTTSRLWVSHGVMNMTDSNSNSKYFIARCNHNN